MIPAPTPPVRKRFKDAFKDWLGFSGTACAISSSIFCLAVFLPGHAFPLKGQNLYSDYSGYTIICILVGFASGAVLFISLFAFWGIVFMSPMIEYDDGLALYARQKIAYDEREQVLRQLNNERQRILHQLEEFKHDPGRSPLKSILVNITPPVGQPRDLEMLQRLCRSCCSLFPGLKEPNVEITDGEHPEGKPASAWCNGSVVTYKSSTLYNHSPEDLLYIMKHELIHAWIIQNGYPDNDAHGELFQAKARELGI